MSIFSGLFKSRDKPKDSYDSSSYSYFFGRTHSGKRVNDRTALQHIIVYACVRVLSEAIAQLPLHVYKYTDNSKERVTKSLYSFIEPDFNFELFQKHKITDEDPDVIYVKPGHELIDISADWIVNL